MEKYIQMCKQAYDLQREYEPEVGDWVWDLLQHQTKFIHNLKQAYDEFGQSLIVVWLPHPAELLKDSVADFNIKYFKENEEWAIISGRKQYFIVRSSTFHEVTLKYYMRIKYNKTWNEEKWTTLPSNK